MADSYTFRRIERSDGRQSLYVRTPIPADGERGTFLSLLSGCPTDAEPRFVRREGRLTETHEWDDDEDAWHEVVIWLNNEQRIQLIEALGGEVRS